MTLKMQEVCAEYKGGRERLAKLYLDLVPRLVAYYRDDGSTFHLQLARQALDYFDKNQMPKHAATLKAQTGLK